MLNEARNAFGFKVPKRHSAFLCDDDTPIQRFGDVKVGVADESTVGVAISTSKAIP